MSVYSPQTPEVSTLPSSPLPSSFFRAASPRRHLREASDPPPTQFSILLKPRTASSPRFDHPSPPISRFRLKSRPLPRFVPASYPGPGRRCPSLAEIDAAWQTWRQGSSGET